MIEKAWMIRNDNVVVPIKSVHPYGKPDFEVITDENTEVASFLYQYGKNKQTAKKYFVIYFAYYIDKANINFKNFDHTAFVIDLIDSKKNARIIFDNNNTSISVNEKLKKFWDIVEKDVIEYLETGFEKKDIKNINRAINHELNQTFLRVRFGGLLNSRSDNNDIYFRISSSGFIWESAIYMFLEKYERNLGIRTVTVVRDGESTGSKGFYKTEKNNPIDRIPISSFREEFEGKKSSIEKLKRKEEDFLRIGPRMIIREFLYEGKSLNDFKLLIDVIGIDHLYKEYFWILEEENANPYFFRGNEL